MPLPISLLYGGYVVRSFLPDGVFLPCFDHGLDFLHQRMCGNSIISIKKSFIGGVGGLVPNAKFGA